MINIFLFVLWLKGWTPLFCALLQVFYSEWNEVPVICLSAH